MKEGLLQVFKCKSEDVEEAFFVKLSQKRRHKEAIIATIHIGLSNARIESMNNKIKVVIRKAYEFRNCIDMIMIVCSNLYKEIRLPYEILKSNKVYSNSVLSTIQKLVCPY
ncbi:transposase [Holdemanella biformis]|uniref:transposase n=1 Tax=Holdemanella biformis TaxID=1735 RepID=UPI0039B3A001